MKILITGVCGFVGSTLAAAFQEQNSGITLLGIDNFIRPGSEINRLRLKRLGVQIFHGDIRLASDFEALPKADWVIDAAANPSVLAGIDGKSSSRQLIEHNLVGTVNLLEYCKAARAGLVMLSSSRVYSIPDLAKLQVDVRGLRFTLADGASMPLGISSAGIREEFSTAPPISLYGSSKLTSETLALEYSFSFGFPIWINRCGVLAGAWQMGTAQQGIFSYWVHAHASRRPLRFIGFDGYGYQVRDAFHPADLATLVYRQMNASDRGIPRLFNVGGGASNSMSLAELSGWCDQRFGKHEVASDPVPRPFDVPWVVMDSTPASRCFDWQPTRCLPSILEEIAQHAEQDPDWLDTTAPA
jgi:CDP-paratose 2-epimerase